MSFVPSGEQFEISHGQQRAVLVEVGGGVRHYSVAGRDVLEPYDEHAMCDGGHGTPLVPWPNRLADGKYTWDGTSHQVPLTEVAKHNAIHGLLRWHNWRALEHREGRVRLGTRLHPMPGYPFALDVAITYALDADGLAVTIEATNVGDNAAPFACGQHPYLSPGAGLVDDGTLELDAATWIDTDNERQLPTGVQPAEGDRDFRKPRTIGEQKLDTAFTDLGRDAEGRAAARFTGPDGRTVELWVDSTYPIIQIFTGDTLSPQRRRHGLGCEPMSAPPNALASGDGVIRLEPGATTTHTWGVRLI